MSGRYAARKRRSVPMELPHSGTAPAPGSVLASGTPALPPASSSEIVDASIAASRPAPGVHVAHDVVHARERLGRLVHDEVGTFGHDLEVVVGDERRDLDDDVARRVETRHLEVHPHEHGPMVGRGRRSLRCSTDRRARRPPRSRPPAASYARAGDAGADLCAREDVSARAGRRPGARADRASRSPSRGLRRVRAAPQRPRACGTGSPCLNTPGLIDAGYRDELKVLLVNTDPTEPYEVHRGDRIAQLVIQPVEACTFASSTRSTARTGAVGSATPAVRPDQISRTTFLGFLSSRSPR